MSLEVVDRRMDELIALFEDFHARYVDPLPRVVEEHEPSELQRFSAEVGAFAHSVMWDGVWITRER